ncbi:hypothetical protein ABT346_20305 [Micromonospora peucetia]|uniref:hypothetical protein n=1 Tax=Micromonospora peucetia TaxID=47871 RepID=UPI003316F386
MIRSLPAARPDARSPDVTRWSRVVIGMLTLAAFGPYLATGVRTEQVVVYAVAVASVALGLWTRIRLTGTAKWVAAGYLALIGIAGLGAAFPLQNHTLYSNGSVIAGLDNLLLPVAVVMVVGAMVGAGADPARLVRTVCVCLVWTMVVNAMLAVYSASSDDSELLARFRLFGDEESVADRAEQLGRYSGIINQPAEAGLLYSVALLAALYLYQQQVGRLTVTLLALALGGVLCVSKVFFLVGAPVAIAYALLTAGRTRRLAAVAAATAGAWVAADTYLDQWDGRDFALRLLPGSGGDQLGLYTAGRVGEQSTLQHVVDVVTSASPAFGVGVGGLKMAYDNGWVEALVIAGFLGVALHTAVLAALLVGWFRTRSRRPESALTGGLVVVVIGASAGLPALTANRAATVVWLLLGLLLLARRSDQPGTWWQHFGQRHAYGRSSPQMSYGQSLRGRTFERMPAQNR